MIFFTGDTHFQHANILKYSNRPFPSIDAMDASLAAAWRERVGDNDEVYHVGDFSLKCNAETRAILERLPGRKHLIFGNHDNGDVRRSSLWASVADYRELKLAHPDTGDRLLVVLSHYPFAVWNASHHGAVNLHGHCHGTYPSSALQLDVGVDCTGYRPLALPEVLARLATLPPHVPRDRHGTDR